MLLFQAMADSFNPYTQNSDKDKDLDGIIRPQELTDFTGQEKIISNLKVFIQAAKLRGESLDHVLFHGPPGLGKTTLAHIIANELGVNMKITSGPVLDKPGDLAGLLTSLEEGDVLFIDEIHRFSKSQQDSLLAAVEKGTVVLIGATTENPSFEVITPLLSRCAVYTLKPLEKADLMELAGRALAADKAFEGKSIEFKETEALLQYSGGDARKLLNALELIVSVDSSDHIIITNDMVAERLQENPAVYDKNGEMHYDIISAFIKSVRGSDPDAAVYWLARMIEGGEDPKFIARRLLILASEDIGLANPNALLLANTCFDAVNKIGWPESRIILSETTIYLATCKKSNSAYMAIDAAQAEVRRSGNLPVPLHLRNAPTALMRDMEYAKGYKYPHDFPGHWVEQQYLPDEIKNKVFYFRDKD